MPLNINSVFEALPYQTNYAIEAQKGLLRDLVSKFSFNDTLFLSAENTTKAYVECLENIKILPALIQNLYDQIVKLNVREVVKSRDSQNLYESIQNTHQNISTDVEFTFPGTSIVVRAHRCMMSTFGGKFFSAILDPQCIDSVQASYLIEEVSPEIFQKYIEFVYTGKIENLSNREAQILYVYGDKNLHDEIKTYCDSQATAQDLLDATMTEEDLERYSMESIREEIKEIRGDFRSDSTHCIQTLFIDRLLYLKQDKFEPLERHIIRLTAE